VIAVSWGIGLVLHQDVTFRVVWTHLPGRRCAE
jgi:hypothetical protein